MKLLAREEKDPAIVAMPAVVGVGIVGVEPQTAIIVPFNVQYIEVAVRVSNV